MSNFAGLALAILRGLSHMALLKFSNDPNHKGVSRGAPILLSYAGPNQEVWQ